MPDTGSVPVKKSLRADHRATRRALSSHQQHIAATRLLSTLSTHPLFLSSKHIAFYWPVDGEISPAMLLAEALRYGKRCYLPCLKPDFQSPRRHLLLFAEIHGESTLIANRYGIGEPEWQLGRTISAAALHLVLVPLVAFDDKGNRLGMGKGFYDQTFEFLQHSFSWRKPRLLGLAHESQKVEHLTAECWDIPLDGIVTDQHYYDVSSHTRRG